MANPSISAVRDQNLVRVHYQSGSSSLAPLTLKVIHQYKDSYNATSELFLLTKQIPIESFSENPDYGTLDTSQGIDVVLANLRYLDNLEIEITENHGSGPLNFRVPVLVHNQNPVSPPNPIRYPQFEPENGPVLKAEKPADNVVVAEPIVNPVIFSTQTGSQLNRIISSRRIRLAPDALTFIAEDINSSSPSLLVENSITNFALNPKFQGTGSIPTGYGVVSPGFILNNIRKPLENTPDGYYWEIRASNPNYLNVLNSVKIQYLDLQPLAQGLAHLSVSFYYQIHGPLNIEPIENLKFKIFFYDNADTPVGNKQEVMPLIYGSTWNRIELRLLNTEIPFSATQYKIELETSPVESSDLFYLKLAIPQVESSAFTTSATYTDRVLDRWEIPPQSLDLPLYFWFKGVYRSDGSIRGLFDSTINGTNGYRITLAYDKLHLRGYDQSGSEVLNLFSDPISASLDGQIAEFGVYLQPNQVEFLLNASPLSTHVLSVPNLESTGRILAGALETSNEAFNNEILGAGIYRRP